MIQSLELKVKLPMLLDIDNKEAVDVDNNWSAGGQTRHVNVKQYFLCKLKYEGLIWIEHGLGEEKNVNLFAKNLPGPPFRNIYKCTVKITMEGNRT